MRKPQTQVQKKPVTRGATEAKKTALKPKEQVKKPATRSGTKLPKPVQKEPPKEEEEEKQKTPKHAEKVEEDEGEAPDIDQMMADIMGGFQSLGTAQKKPSKPEKQKLPFILSLEVKTSKEIIKELNKAFSAKDNKLALSLLKGLHDHTDLDKDDKVYYLEQEAKLAVELGHDDTAISAAESLLLLNPYNANANYYLLCGLLMEENDKSTTYAARVYQRAIAIADHPELFPGSKLAPGLREELEQLKYKVNIRLENMKAKESLLVATSTYVNDCLGAETSALYSRTKKDKSQQIIASFPDELLNHKIIAAACGDFHTIVLSKGSVLHPGGGCTDVYGFGQNIYGQVTASTEQKQIIRPSIVPFFVGKSVKLIDAKGSRSVAVCESGDIYEWGFPDIAVRKTGYLEGIEMVKIGLTFNLYLTKSEECYIHGRLTDMEGDNIVEYQKPTYVGLVWQIEDKTFTQIATGYNHALLLSKTGKVYVWGAGKYGQLGLTYDVRILLDPFPIETLCSESEKIVKVFATANHSFALSNLGVLYHWGLMSMSEGGESDILWSPAIYRLEDSIRVLEVAGLQHEIIIMDQTGKLFICRLLEMNKEFREMPKPSSSFTDDYRKVAGCGIGHQIYLKPFIIPEKCSFTLSSPKWTTGEWANAKLKLASNSGPYPAVNVAGIRLSIYLSQKNSTPQLPHDYQAYATDVLGKPAEITEAAEFKGKHLIWNMKRVAGQNDIAFDCQIRTSELDESELSIDFCPKDACGKCYLHILIAEEYIGSVPIGINIQEGKPIQPKALDKILHEAIMERRKEEEEKKKKLEAELKAKREREEAEEKRRKQTEERAAEALKELKKKIKETEKKLAEERKQRLEMVTGGGFDLNKTSKKN